MAFHVPPAHEGLHDQVVSRFRILLRRRVITGITDFRLNLWLKNFFSPEEQYLAARVLDNLSYRSQAMVTSSIQHVNECVLPCELRRHSIGKFVSFASVLPRLASDLERVNSRLKGLAFKAFIDEFENLPAPHREIICDAIKQPSLAESHRNWYRTDDRWNVEGLPSQAQSEAQGVSRRRRCRHLG